MATITLNNTISYESISMQVEVKSDEAKSYFIPYVIVPKSIMNDIYEGFDIGCPTADCRIQLFSLPNIIIDEGCTSGCTPSVWSRIQGRNATLLGKFEFAVEKFNGDFFDWYIVATCERSVLYLN